MNTIVRPQGLTGGLVHCVQCPMPCTLGFNTAQMMNLRPREGKGLFSAPGTMGL